MITGQLKFGISLLLMCCFWLAPMHVSADDGSSGSGQDFSVVAASDHIEDHVVLLDVVFGLEFSEQLKEALHSGVPLVLKIEIEALRERSYWWSETIASITQRFKVSYNALTGHYLIHNLNADLQFRLPNMEAVIAVLGNMNDFPLLDEKLLEKDEHYTARVRIRIDDDYFPVPLRLMSYVSSDWDQESDWYSWPLLQH